MSKHEFMELFDGPLGMCVELSVKYSYSPDSGVNDIEATDCDGEDYCSVISDQIEEACWVDIERREQR